MTHSILDPINGPAYDRWLDKDLDAYYAGAEEQDDDSGEPDDQPGGELVRGSDGLFH